MITLGDPYYFKETLNQLIVVLNKGAKIVVTSRWV